MVGEIIKDSELDTVHGVKIVEGQLIVRAQFSEGLPKVKLYRCRLPEEEVSDPSMKKDKSDSLSWPYAKELKFVITWQ